MKKTILILSLFILTLSSFAQTPVKLTNGAPAYIPNYLILQGSLYFYDGTNYTNLGDTALMKADSTSFYYTQYKIDSLLLAVQDNKVTTKGTVLNNELVRYSGDTGDSIQASNLTINDDGDLLPNDTDSVYLGSSTKTFKDAYFTTENGLVYTINQIGGLQRDYSEQSAILQYSVHYYVVGGVWGISLRDESGAGYLSFTLDDKVLRSADDSLYVNATSFAGTSLNPNTVYVYVQNDGADNPELIASNVNPDALIHAHVANYKTGAVSATDVKIYGKADAVIQMYEIANNVYHRFFYEGPLYQTGLTQTVTSTDATIGIGTYEVIFETITTEEKQVSTDSLFFIKNDGTYNTLNDFSFDAEYSDGVTISDGKVFNVILGIMENGGTNIMALIQRGSSEEYKDFNKAFEDKKNQIVYQPNDDFLKNIFVSVCRIIVKRVGTTYTLQVFDDGEYYQDLRGDLGGGGGAGTASNIADGTVDNQFTTWNNTTGEWTPTTGITFDDSLNVTGKVVTSEIKTPTILSNNFYVTLNRDTTDAGTWKYVISGDTLIWSVYNGAAWDVIQKLIND